MNKRTEKIILAISGNIAAGKNEMANYVEKNYGGYAYRSSEVLRDILKRMYLLETRENMQKASTMLREHFGDDILSYISSFDLKKIKKGIIAINGVRRFGDLEFIRKDFRIVLVYINSDLENRYKRICERWENTDDQTKTFSQFKKDQEREAEKQIRTLEKKADFVIENNGTLEEFYGKIDTVIKKINK